MRIALYVRVSTQRQAQTQTIEQQLDRLRKVAADRRWVLAEDRIFRDDGYSGASLRRPGLDMGRTGRVIRWPVGGATSPSQGRWASSEPR